MWPALSFMLHGKSAFDFVFAYNCTQNRACLTWCSQLLYLVTYLLTYSVEQSPSWENNRFPASQEISRILWAERFITLFKSARHLSLSWARTIQSMPPHPTCWISNLILSSHLHLGLPSGLFGSDFPTKNPAYTSTLPHMCNTPRPSNSRCDPRRIFCKKYRSPSSSFCSFLHSPVTSSFLGSNILLSALFLTPSAHVPPSVWVCCVSLPILLY
jgi:hypothetical protein